MLLLFNTPVRPEELYTVASVTVFREGAPRLTMKIALQCVPAHGLTFQEFLMTWTGNPAAICFQGVVPSAMGVPR